MLGERPVSPVLCYKWVTLSEGHQTRIVRNSLEPLQNGVTCFLLRMRFVTSGSVLAVPASFGEKMCVLAQAEYGTYTFMDACTLERGTAKNLLIVVNGTADKSNPIRPRDIIGVNHPAQLIFLIVNTNSLSLGCLPPSRSGCDKL